VRQFLAEDAETAAHAVACEAPLAPWPAEEPVLRVVIGM
jgi:hypothetical protein